MAFPVTLNGRTYTLTDFEGTNYVDGLPDAFEDFVTHAGDIYNSTSTTSNSIGTGSKTFTVESNKPYQAGTPLRIADAAAPSTNFLDTVVTSYSGTTLVVNSIGFGGSGTKTSWTVNIGGAKTVDGTLGLSQGGTGATDAAGARTNIDVYSKSEADTRYLNISGDSADISFGANMSFGDSNKAIFGAGSDLQIYHNGTNSFIADSGTGNLLLRSNNVSIQNAAGTETVAQFVEDGFVRLFHDNSQVFTTISTGASITGSLGIGTSSPTGLLDLSATTGSGTLNIISTVNAVNAGNKIAFFGASRSDADEEMAYIQPLFVSNSGGAGNVQEGHLTFGTSGSEAMRIASNGFVGIGDSDPGVIVEAVYSDSTLYDDDANAATDCALRIHNTSATTGAYSAIKLHSNNATGSVGQWAIGSVSTGTNYDNNLVFHTRTASSTYAERMRIDTSGFLLVGKTSSDATTTGFEAQGNGQTIIGRTNGTPLKVNRLSSDGDIAHFRADGTTVGSIGVAEGGGAGCVYICNPQSGNAGLYFAGRIQPTDHTGDRSDNTVDLGSSSFRFDDIYATNATIQTSDQNEKQQIASLTTAEMDAAKAISALFKTFKWNDAVASKGDAARTHTGVMAQEIETAMTNAGLDAGDYAFYMSNTWWETQTDVPAVAAVAEVLDDDGNVVTEAVEAKDAYTRTDTYDTLSEAPAGATERTRKGIRYPELLSFVGAATEQRLADIETRLTALEA